MISQLGYMINSITITNLDS